MSIKSLSKEQHDYMHKVFPPPNCCFCNYLEERTVLRNDIDIAGSIFQEIKESFEGYECMHGKKHHVFTPPMYIPELIHCIVNKARLQGMEAVYSHINCELVTLEVTVADTIWKQYQEKKNEMEGAS